VIYASEESCSVTSDWGALVIRNLCRGYQEFGLGALDVLAVIPFFYVYLKLFANTHALHGCRTNNDLAWLAEECLVLD
jgi:hypothetical protein